MKPRDRALWRRTAETREGNNILYEARRLSTMREYEHLSDAELIRLAYWGVSGSPPEPPTPNDERPQNEARTGSHRAG